MPELLAIFDPSQIETWMAAGGYVFLFFVLFGCGLGLPVPEDIPLIIAGYFIAQGHMTWAAAGLLAWCGIIGGDLVLYHIARRYGRNITRVPFIGKHINESRLGWIEKKFEKYGIWVVAVGRLFAGVRGAMVVVAGTIRYNRLKFVIADGIAALVSGGLFMALGHYLGKKLPFDQLIKKVESSKSTVSMIVLAVAIFALVWFGFRFWRRQKAHTDKFLHVTPSQSASATSTNPATESVKVSESVTVTKTITVNRSTSRPD